MPPNWLLLIVLIAAATPAAADPSCEVAAHLTQIDIASQRLLTAGEDAATGIVSEMEAAIGAVSASDAGLLHDKLDPYRLDAFLQSRAEVTRLFRTQGLGAAQTRIEDPTFQAMAVGVRGLEALLGCNGAAAADHLAERDHQSWGADAARIARADTAKPAGSGRAFVGSTGFQMALWFGATLAMALLVAGTIATYHLRRSRRRYQRFICDLGAEIVIGSDIIPARIAEISRSGAKLIARNGLKAGDHGMISLAGYGQVRFRVVWANSNFAGVAFRPALGVSPRNFIASATGWSA